MAKKPMVWVICYVNIDRLHTLSRDLYRYSKYKTIEACIPKIKILKKKFKGKNHYEEIPLMMNYGLFRVPRYFIPNPYFLQEMKRDVECIYNWLIDTSAVATEPLMHYGDTLFNPMRVALAKDSEIKPLVEAAKINSIYTAKDLETLYPGKIIRLHGYPFDNIDAEIQKINYTKREVEVKLLLSTSIKVVKVAFDNIFFTIYQSQYLESAMKEQSIEAIVKPNKSTDNLYKDDKE